VTLDNFNAISHHSPSKKGGQDGKKEVIHAKNQRHSTIERCRPFQSGYSQGLFDRERDCKRVLVFGLHSYKSVKNILEAGLDKMAAMKLSGMLEGLREQIENTQYKKLSFEK